MEITVCRNFTWSVCSDGPDERSKTSDLSCLVRSTKAIAHLSRDAPIIDTSAIFSKFDSTPFRKARPSLSPAHGDLGLGACWKASVREKEKGKWSCGGWLLVVGSRGTFGQDKDGNLCRAQMLG